MFTFDPLPHAEAVSRIGGLPLVSREVMDGLLPELRAYAFTISGLDVGDQMARVRDMIKAVPSGEKNWDKARKEIAAELADDLGGKAAQRRAELLLRTHVFRSYAATRYRNLMQQVDVFPFWQYRTHGDGRVRPSHAALNGKIFAAGHEIWQRIFPPWDWGCRCIVVPLTRAAVERLTRKPVVSDDAARAILLPTQLAVAEVYDAHMADMILKAERLPGGIPLNRTPTFSDSPWSIPGNVHHDWKLIQARYADQPEVLAAFKQWADKQEIAPGKTVSMWIDDVQSIAPQPPKLTLKKKFQKQAQPAPAPAPVPPAQRSFKDVKAAVDALKTEHEEALKLVQAAQIKAMSGAYGTQAYIQAQSDLAAARANLDAVREKGRVAIEIPAAERGKVSIKSQQAHPQNLTQGVAHVERFTHSSLLPSIDVNLISGRANAGLNGTINVRPNQTASVIAHEITHVTEFHNAETLQASRDFLAKRRKAKEKVKKLRTIYPGYGYESYEIAFEDDFSNRGGTAYSGKLYFPGVNSAAGRKLWTQALKDDAPAAFGHLYATELLTIGIERVIEDPIAFATLDPDYFEFVVSTLQKLTP